MSVLTRIGSFGKGRWGHSKRQGHWWSTVRVLMTGGLFNVLGGESRERGFYGSTVLVTHFVPKTKTSDWLLGVASYE